MASALSSSHLR
jgi:hypothetical protein